MDNDNLNGMWVTLETMLQLGKEPLAQNLFRFFIDFTYLDALRHAPVPVFLTYNDYKPASLESLLNAKTEKSWGSIAMAYRHQRYELSKDCFSRAINERYHFAINTAIRLAEHQHHAALFSGYFAIKK